jgi:hypothetical protein
MKNLNVDGGVSCGSFKKQKQMWISGGTPGKDFISNGFQIFLS